MRAVDTNVLVRLLHQDAPEQTAAGERFVGRGAWISTLVLAETAWVLTEVYEVGPGKLTRMIEMLQENELVVLQDAEAVRAAVSQFKAKPSLGFTDCLILQIARQAGHVPLGTFDRKLARHDGAELLSSTAGAS